MNKIQEIHSDQRLADILCLRSFISSSRTTLSPSLTRASLLRQNQLIESTVRQAKQNQLHLQRQFQRLRKQRQELQSQRDSLKKQKIRLQNQYARQQSAYSQRRNRFFREQNEEFLTRVNSRERAKVKSREDQLSVLSSLFNLQQQQRTAKWIQANQLIAQQQLERTINMDRQRQLKQLMLQRTKYQLQISECSNKIAEARLDLAETKLKQRSDSDTMARLCAVLDYLKDIHSKNIRQAKQLQKEGGYEQLRNQRLASKQLTNQKNLMTLQSVVQVCQAERDAQAAKALQLQQLNKKRKQEVRQLRVRQSSLSQSNKELTQLKSQQRKLWRTIFIIKQHSLF